MTNIKKFKSSYILIIAAVAVLLALRFFVGTLVAVSGSSMYPTFKDGGFVYGTYIRSDTEVKVGDVVMAKDPNSNRLLIKRVLGTPGMTIKAGSIEEVMDDVHLNENEYYLVGDNRPVSLDSRSFGPVTREGLVYKYANMYWSMSDILITAVLPVILLLVALTIVFIPSRTEFVRRVPVKKEDAIA